MPIRSPTIDLHEYEELQFLNPNPNALVAIQKTETQGDLYDTVLFGDQTINYPRPFMFTLQPAAQHPNQHLGQKLSRVLCLYDNAGESFSARGQIPRLAQLLAIWRCRVPLAVPVRSNPGSQVPQGLPGDHARSANARPFGAAGPRASGRARTRSCRRPRTVFAGTPGLRKTRSTRRPLILIVTKYDCWSSLLESGRLDPPWVVGPDGVHCGLQFERIESLSKKLRALLWNLCPEFVPAAENFAEQVIYVPVSATGCSPELDPNSGALGVRPRDMNPMWTEVPLLYLLSRCMEGLVPYVRPKMKAAAPVAGVNMLPPHLRKQSNGQTRDH